MADNREIPPTEIQESRRRLQARYNREQQREPRRWYKRKRYLLLAGTGVLLAAVLLWLVPSCLFAKGQAIEVVTAFFEAAESGNSELAVEYHSSTAGYRSDLAEKIRTGEFESLFQGFESISINDVEYIAYSSDAGGSAINLSGSVNYVERPSAPLEVSLLKESGLWKITGFYIEENQ